MPKTSMPELKPPPWNPSDEDLAKGVDGDKRLAEFVELAMALPENDDLVDEYLRTFAKGTYERRVGDLRVRASIPPDCRRGCAKGACESQLRVCL
jgi:hypothetical protein